MKCPIDQTEMEKGNLVSPYNATWLPQGYNLFNRKGGKKVAIAYKCPKCGKIELTTEVK